MSSIKKEENDLFNDVLNTIYLQLYGVGHTVTGHLDSGKGNPLLILHGLLILINSKECFIYTIQQIGRQI